MYKPARIWGHYPQSTDSRCKVSDNFADTQNYYKYLRHKTKQLQLIIYDVRFAMNARKH